MIGKILRRLLLIILALVLALGTWLGWEAYHVYSGVSKLTGVVVPRTRHEGVARTVTGPLLTNQRLNILVLGSDNDQKTQEARPLTQSMIIVTIDPLHHKVGMLSIPRDFYVPIRGVGMAKIMAAHEYGGVALARETVERLFHVYIDYYAWVGLTGFIRVLNTFNGVTVDVSRPVLDDTYPNDINTQDPYAYKRVFIPPGWQHMSGRQALEYVRSRHGDLVGDFGRSARQQQVLLELRQKADALNVVTHLPQLVSDLQGKVKTDLTLDEIYQLASWSRHINRGAIQQVVLSAPNYASYGWTPDGQSIVIPDWSKIKPVVSRMFAPAQSAPQQQRTPPTPTPTSSSVTFAVTTTPTPLPTEVSTREVPPTPTPTPTPQPVEAKRLPARLIYVDTGKVVELSRSQRLTDLTCCGGVAMPALSPDARSLAFIRYSGYASDIIVKDLRTGVERTVTDDRSSDVASNLWAAWPSWSSDGRTLLFSTDRAKLTAPPSDFRPIDLAVYSMPAAGGSGNQITTPAAGSGGDTDPGWRPGTSQFAYVKWNYEYPSNVPYSQLVVKDNKTGGAWALTPYGERVLQPAWNSAGNRLVYVHTDPATGTDEIDAAAVTWARGAPRLGTVTVLARGDVAQPAFTPDGKWVSFLRRAGDSFQLYLEPSRGGALEKVSTVSTHVDAQSRPIWVR